MGECFRLVNMTRGERVEISGFGVDTAREIVRSHGVSAVLTWYMLSCRGDQIAFISDYDTEKARSFFGRVLGRSEIDSFTDVTEQVIDAAMNVGVVIDKGWREIDGDPSIRIRQVEVSRH